MNISFLGQGFSAVSKNAVGNKLVENLAKTDYHTFTGITAFTSLSGINGLNKHINGAPHLKAKAIITGIDQKGTSKEALQALLNSGIPSYIFYQPAWSIFHPKMYLFEGDKTCSLILGSSNLTAQGLFANVEGSFLVEVDNSQPAELAIINELKTYFKGLFDFSDPNLKPLTQRLIIDLVSAGIVPTEAQRKAIQDKQPTAARRSTKLASLFPKRTITAVPADFKSNRVPKPVVPIVRRKKLRTAVVPGNLAWIRRKLPASSVQLSPGGNPTGGLRLVQDHFSIAGQIIDQTTYFRNIVFSKGNWTTIKTTPLVEVTKANFDVTIKGIFIGNYDLEVRHKPSGDAGQNNYTTSISWGDLSDQIKQSKLTNAQLELYYPQAGGNTYSIIIK